MSDQCSILSHADFPAKSASPAKHWLIEEGAALGDPKCEKRGNGSFPQKLGNVFDIMP
jgi:hypothetical protein